MPVDAVTGGRPTEGAAVEKPANGVAGLKHWKYDVTAGLMVSLTSLPFSLGIAVASGAPPIAGLMSAIIAGLIFPFLGGAYVTISGPAAGLAPALFAAMLTLGHGHLDAGYPLLLAVICMVGAVQVVLSKLGAAKLSAAFPVAVVEGMLASIGLLIVAKELPHFMGHDFKAHAFFSILGEVPSQASLINPSAFGVGVVCLAMMFILSLDKVRKRMVLPPSLAVVMVGLVLGFFLNIDAQHRISIPDNILKHGITLPNFKGLFSDPSLGWAIVATVLTLVMIDGVESLATIKAIDKVDPFKRRSDPDRTLMSMGISNILSSVAGGLTIIPGGVKSKLCIVSGGRTLWANFYNALFLIGFLFLGKGLINLIPYSALAAILIHTGYKMFEPKIWKHVAHIGPEQILLFATTIIVTLSTDLLMGIFVGMLLKLVLNIVFTSRHVWSRVGRPMGFPEYLAYGVGHLGQLFRNPVVSREEVDGTYHLHFDRPIVCFNSMHLNRELERVPATATAVRLHIGENVAMIDHTSCDTLLHFADEFAANGTTDVEIVGLDRMRKVSHAENGTRLAPVKSLKPDSVTAADDAAEPADTLAEMQPVD
jgi:MFS superfamily sulfate permease-like transporter